MAITRRVPIDIADGKYSLLTADTGTSGPTYSAAVDIEAMQEITAEFEEGDVRELRAEGTVFQRSVAAGATVLTIRWAGIQPAVLAALYGHVNVASGTTPNQVQILTGNPLASRPYFKLQGLALNNDGGSSRITFYKVQMDGEMPSFGFADDEWGEFETTATAYWTTSTTVVNAVAQTLKWDIQLNETALANAAA